MVDLIPVMHTLDGMLAIFSLIGVITTFAYAVTEDSVGAAFLTLVFLVFSVVLAISSSLLPVAR